MGGWTTWAAVFGGFILFRFMQYQVKLFESFRSVQEILADNVVFENGGTIYENMTEGGCKFTTQFEWKKNEDGSLAFPEGLKKFMKRGSHRT